MFLYHTTSLLLHPADCHCSLPQPSHLMCSQGQDPGRAGGGGQKPGGRIGRVSAAAQRSIVCAARAHRRRVKRHSAAHAGQQAAPSDSAWAWAAAWRAADDWHVCIAATVPADPLLRHVLWSSQVAASLGNCKLKPHLNRAYMLCPRAPCLLLTFVLFDTGHTALMQYKAVHSPWACHNGAVHSKSHADHASTTRKGKCHHNAAMGMHRECMHPD